MGARNEGLGLYPSVQVKHRLITLPLSAHGGKYCPICMRQWFDMRSNARQLALDIFQNDAATEQLADYSVYAIQELTFHLSASFCEEWLSTAFPRTYGF